MMMPTLAWDIGTFLQNATKTIKQWGSYLIILIGVVLIIVSIWQIAKGLISHGKGQTNWAVAIIMLIIGGALMAGGFGLVSTIASGGGQTINELGAGGTQTWLLR
jgi:uncharacterized membrane protein